MADKEIHLTFTPLEANALAVALRVLKEMINVAPGKAVYSNLGPSAERDLVIEKLDAVQATLHKQLEQQMPKK